MRLISWSGLLLAFLVSACGGSASSSLYTLQKTQDCLTAKHVVLGGGRDVGAADVLVRVLDIDVAGAVGVGLTRDRACERHVLDERVDAENLAGLQVQPHLHGEACVALQTIVDPGHGGER